MRNFIKEAFITAQCLLMFLLPISVKLQEDSCTDFRHVVMPFHSLYKGKLLSRTARIFPFLEFWITIIFHNIFRNCIYVISRYIPLLHRIIFHHTRFMSKFIFRYPKSFYCKRNDVYTFSGNLALHNFLFLL
jgi:hypothetical protein